MLKKAQIEMIGLVIVVILITIGLLLYIKFGVFREESSANEDPTLEYIYSTNLMGAIFNIKICEDEPKKVE